MVVIVDDDANVRKALENLFTSVQLPVATFESPRAFLKVAKSLEPLCFVIDVMLPEQTGLEFMDALMRAKIVAPTIFISGHADVRVSVRAMKAGAADFFTKPVDCEQLLIAVRSAIAANSRKSD